MAHYACVLRSKLVEKETKEILKEHSKVEISMEHQFKEVWIAITAIRKTLEKLLDYHSVYGK